MIIELKVKPRRGFSSPHLIIVRAEPRTNHQFLKIMNRNLNIKPTGLAKTRTKICELEKLLTKEKDPAQIANLAAARLVQKNYCSK